jgi:effector-binding domain-containing protein
MEEILVVEVPPLQVLGMRERGKYEKIPGMIMNIIQYAMEKGITVSGPPIFVMHETSREEAMKADQEGTADIEIAWPVEGTAAGKGAIRRYILAGGTMAKLVHRGPYEACGPAYQRLFSWIDQNKKRIAGPIREVYPNDPREVAPDEIMTEIYIPIA